MDNQKAIEKLKTVEELGDTERGHEAADAILCELLIELGYQDVVDEFNKLEKWYA